MVAASFTSFEAQLRHRMDSRVWHGGNRWFMDRGQLDLDTDVI
jgi:hypothetical protein